MHTVTNVKADLEAIRSLVEEGKLLIQCEMQLALRIYYRAY